MYILKQATFTMKWRRESNSLNNRPAYRAHTEKADYMIVPVHGGFRIHHKALNAPTWATDETLNTLRVAKELCEWIDAERITGETK